MWSPPVGHRELLGEHRHDLAAVELGAGAVFQLLLGDAPAKQPVPLHERDVDGLVGHPLGLSMICLASATMSSLLT